MGTEACVAWESLIAQKTELHRPTYAPQRIEDPDKRRKRINERRRSKSPGRIAYKKKYREEHRDELNAKNREYRATPEGKRKTQEYNKKWRKENREYDRERKRAWWRKTHPNPRPIGRPRKPKTEVADGK